MTAYVISTFRSTPLSLAAGDTLSVTAFGSITPATNAASAAVTGSSGDTVVLDGIVSDSQGNQYGMLFTGDGNTFTIGAGAYVRGTNQAVCVQGAAGKNKLVSSGQIASQSESAIFMAGQANTLLLNAGSVTIGARGVTLDGGANSFANAGQITGINNQAVVIGSGGNAIFNSGTIIGVGSANPGTGSAIQIGSNGGVNTIINTGLIRGTNGNGLDSQSGVNLINSGTIDGIGGKGVFLGFASTSTVMNSGYIFGRGTTPSDAAIYTSLSDSDTVVNNGFLFGVTTAAKLGGGNDLFDGRGGLQFGDVQGSDGNDVLLGGVGNDFLYGGNDNDQLSGGSAGDYLDGGAGFDIARYDTGGAVTASLANPAANTGDAAGDTYISIEGLIGSQAGDVLLGDVGDNTLFGLGGADGIAGGDGADTIYGGDGADVIAGQAGNDVIQGDAGGDTIQGGAGADTFVYTALADGGDLIQDFNYGGTKDTISLVPLFNSTGYAGTTPRATNILQVLQNGADTDIYVYGAFMLRLANVYAPAIDDSYFQFQ